MAKETGQAIVVTKEGVQVVPHTADLIAWMAARGHIYTGDQKRRGLRPELLGQPMFSGLIGPMWGGEETPLRYEDQAVYNELSD